MLFRSRRAVMEVSAGADREALMGSLVEGATVKGGSKLSDLILMRVI